MVGQRHALSEKTEPRPAGSAKGAARTAAFNQELAHAALRFVRVP